MKPAAAWERVSTDEQGERHSLDTQRELNNAVAARNEYKLKHFGGSESAMGNKPRPLFDALVRDIEAGKFAALIVVSEDRLYRNVRDQERLWVALKQTRTALFVNAERQNLRDSSTQLVATFKAKASNLEQGARHDSSARARIRMACLGFPSSGLPPLRQVA